METCKGSNHTTLLLPLYPHPTHPTPTPQKNTQPLIQIYRIAHSFHPKVYKLTIYLNNYLLSKNSFAETVVAIRFFSAVLFQPRSNNMPLTEERPIDQQDSEEISGVYQGMCSSNIEATKQMNALDPMDMDHAPTRPCRCPCP